MFLPGDRRMKANETSWHREGRGCWVRNDGLARVRKVGFLWVCGRRETLEAPWQDDRAGFDRLWAAQHDVTRRHPEAAPDAPASIA